MSQLTDALMQWTQSKEAWIADNGHMYSPKQFKQDIAKIQQLFIDMNVQRGDSVFVAMPNSYAFAVVYVALLSKGIVVVPGNPSMPKVELERFLSRFEAKLCFVAPTSDSDWHDVVTDAFTTAIGSLSFDDVTIEIYGDRWNRMCPQALSFGEVASSMSSPAEDHPAVLMFTSGTTGSPKGVLLTHRHLMSGVKNVQVSHQLTHRDVSYCMLPLFHINAQVIVLLSTLCSGGRLVMTDRFHASTFWQDIETHKVTWVSCVPTILSILAKGEMPTPNTTHLRFIRSASAPLSPAILSRFEATTGIPVIESYGMTEAAGQICINPLPPGIRKAGSVGLPVGVELHVVVNGIREAATNEIGEIVIRGGNVIGKYVGQPLHGTELGTPYESFIFTGDLGYRDNDGYVFITGRSKEMINRAGEKLSPREIEDVLIAHVGVQKAAVIGVPDTLYGERVVAYVVPAVVGAPFQTSLTDELNKLCEASLAKHKRPSEIRVVETLPVGPTGKVQKHLLKEVVVHARLA